VIAGTTGGPGSAMATVAHDAGVAEPALPERVTITFDAPKGATITNLTTKTGFGAVPNVSVAGSRTPVSFQLSLKGFRDVVVDVIPDKDQTIKPDFVKATAGSSRTPSGSPATPPPDAATPVLKPDPGPPATKPPPDDDCPELPCLKDPLKSAPSGGG